MRITSKGQVTIPIEIRERAGLLPETQVDFIVDGQTGRIVRASSSRRESRGARAVRLRGSATAGMSTASAIATSTSRSRSTQLRDFG